MRAVFATHHLVNDCMEEIYRVPVALYREEIQRFIMRNNEFLRNPHTGFIFRTEYYGSLNKGVRLPRLVKELEEEFLDFLLAHQNTLDSEVSIKHFLISSINFTVSVEDLYEIFPKGLHQYVEGYSKEVNTMTTRMDSEVLSNWVKSKQPQINRINEILAMNLLIS